MHLYTHWEKNNQKRRIVQNFLYLGIVRIFAGASTMYFYIIWRKILAARYPNTHWGWWRFFLCRKALFERSMILGLLHRFEQKGRVGKMSANRKTARKKQKNWIKNQLPHGLAFFLSFAVSFIPWWVSVWTIFRWIESIFVFRTS